MRFILTAGQVHDATQASALLMGYRAKHVIADRGYVGRDLQEEILSSGAKPVIPPKKNARFIPPFDKKIYRERNVIERMICKLKHFRRVATRFEKNAMNFLAMIYLAATHLWLR